MKSIAIQETGFIKQIHIAKLDKRDIYAYSLGSEKQRPGSLLGPVFMEKRTWSSYRHGLYKKVIETKQLLQDFDLTIIPLINTHGHRKAVRGDASSEDLNRTFIQKTESPVAEAVMEWIEQQDPFDLAIDFHGKRTAAGFFCH